MGDSELNPGALDAAGKAIYLAQHPDGDWDRAKRTVATAYGRNWTAPAALAVRAYLNAAPGTEKAQALREAAESLTTGTWPDQMLPGVQGAARELTLRAEMLELRQGTEQASWPV